VLACAVLAGQAEAGLAQAGQTLAGTGALAGRLTDIHSAPLDGATVVLRNESTGAEAHTRTGKNGSYRFAGLVAGNYTLEAESSLGRGRLEGILVTAGSEARVQAAMEFEPGPPGPIQIPIQITDHAIDALKARGRLADRDLSAGNRIETPVLVADTEPLGLMAVIAQPLPVAAAPGMPLIRAARPPTVDRDLALDAVRVAAVMELQPLLQLSLAGLPMVSRSSRIEPVQVAAQAVDPVAPAVTTTVTGAQVRALPASGRRWQDFVLDTPTASSGQGGTAQTSLRGAGQQPAETTLDGASTRLAFGGAGSGTGRGASQGSGGGDQNAMGQAWAGGRGSVIAEAAIRRVETAAGNAEAEGTRSAGGRIGVVTESGESRDGGNGLHGQGFVFDRQNTWGARNPFTEWVKETAPAAGPMTPVFTPEPYTPPDHETMWGFGAGGALRRERLFWFAALDGLNRNDPGLATVKNPAEFFAQPANDQMLLLCARLGLSTPGPEGGPGNCPMDKVVAKYSQLLETLDGLLGPSARTAAQWVVFARIDWKAAERHRLTLEGIGAKWNSPGGGLTRVSESYGANSFGTSEASEAWLLGRWEAFLTPNLLAVTQGSVGRTILSTHAGTASAFEQTFLGPSLWSQLPQIVVDSRYGFTIGNPARFGQGSYPDERLYEGQESLDWVHGRLLVKAGVELSHNSDATSLLRNATGTYSYSSVENFASDALVFGAFGSTSPLNPDNQHNCDQTGKVWQDVTGTLRGLGSLPCYSYFSQTMGPTDWNLSTNDWAGFATAQWQTRRLMVVSAGLRWEMEQMPPPLPALANADLPQAGKMPRLGNNFGPRISMALGSSENHWPVLRVGYGMYFGRTENATLETALTQTGSFKGDLNFFIRPTDGFSSATAASEAPPFPCVMPVAANCGWTGSAANIVKPGAVEFAPGYRNAEVQQGVAALEESLPGHVEVTASAMMSLGRRLPVSIDTNFDPTVNPGSITYGVVDGTGMGPIKTTQITVPFYASWPSPTSATGFAGRKNANYQQISEIMSRTNSTYEAAMIKIARFGRRGLSLHAHYTYAHAMDWNPNETTTVAGSDVLDPAHFSEEYGTSDLDVRHSGAMMAIYEAPWKLRGGAGLAANGWMLSGTGQFRSGMPYTMRTSGSLAEEFDLTTGAAIVGLGPGMNGSGGDNRVYGVGANEKIYNIGRNTYRYPSTWKADLRLGKSFDLGAMRKLDLLVESFNLFNHQNVTELETTGYYLEPGSIDGSLPTLNFQTGLKANTTAFGQPLNVNATNFYRERQVQLGVRMRF
jgi:hypothetical protein